jgi:alpha-N-arabinofuranosidase
VPDPHIAVTELQLFAHFGGQPRPAKALHPDRLPTPATISEALYLFTLINAFIRMQGAVELLTHSATVNHGGGLRKSRERVWANPVHYAHHIAAAMAGGTPLKVKVSCAVFSTTHSFRAIPAHQQVPLLDAMAVIGKDGSRLIVYLLNRSARDEAVEVDLVIEGLDVAPQARVIRLAGESMYDQNSQQDPERIAPRASTLVVQDGQASLSVAPYSLVRLIFDLLPA